MKNITFIAKAVKNCRVVIGAEKPPRKDCVKSSISNIRKVGETMHLHTTICCSHVFTANDIQPPLMSQQEALGTSDKHLYGGNAKRFARATCPECQKEYIMWMKPASGGYKILTISQVESTEPEEPQSELASQNINVLRKMASEAGIKDYTRLKKTELIEQLEAV